MVRVHGPAQRAFCREVKERFPEFFHNSRVLEIGSRNINGSVREGFAACEYVGVDCHPGPAVDVVCLGHEYPGEPESFDVVCSAETLEHDPHAARTIAHMLRLLRPGGLLFMTCAGTGRAEHGTIRTGESYGPDAGFYRNVTVAEFLRWLLAAEFDLRELHVRRNPAAHDLYCYCIKDQTHP
jgi:SAM-dependent methyltransferase